MQINKSECEWQREETSEEQETEGYSNLSVHNACK
jgi:hypothetical protein